MFRNRMMDLHNHTIWSDGDHDPNHIIRNAITNGIDAIGISDHFNTVKCSSVTIKKLDNYINMLGALKEKYKGKIEVLSGIEICMNKEWSDIDDLPYEKLNELDYVLFEYVDLFSDSVKFDELKQYTDPIKCHKGLAHTDPFEFESRKGLSFNDFSKILKDNNLFWEININPGYYYFDYIMDNRCNSKTVELLNSIKNSKVQITIGSDTHSLLFYDIERIRYGNKLINELLD